MTNKGMGKDRLQAGVVIRKAKESDMPAIIGNWISLMAQNYKFNPEANKHRREYVQVYERFLLKQIRGRISTVLVAEAASAAEGNPQEKAMGDGEIIGHIMLEIKKIPPVYEIEREGYVDELFVKEGFRGKKIGTMLLKEGESWARKKGMRQFGLMANVKNTRARQVYLKFGLADLTTKMIKLL